MTHWRWYFITAWILHAFIYTRSNCTLYGQHPLILLSGRYVGRATLNDTQTLLEDLLQNYNIDVRPALDQTQSVNATIVLSMKSIEAIDEVKEMFAFVGGLIVTWSDPRMSWTSSLYGGVEEVTTSYSKVWVPEVVLTNPSERIESLGEKWQRVRYRSNGSAEWIPGNYFKTDCPINARRFPFDIQKCPISLSPLGYPAREINLTSLSDKVKLDMFSGNGEWDIVDTEAENSLFANFASQITFIIHLKRKPEFIVINIIIPTAFLCFLSSFAFLLVPESGERVSFCVTVFLAISVFLTIISDILPKTSEPVPVISYALMLGAALSSTTSIVAILNLRLYHREDQLGVPQWLQSLYIAVTLGPWYKRSLTVYVIRRDLDSSCANASTCLQRNQNKVRTRDHEEGVTNKSGDNSGWLTLEKHDDDMHSDVGNETGGYHSKPTVPEEYVHVTWRKISTMIDGISFVLFTLAGLIICGYFMVATLT